MRTKIILSLLIISGLCFAEANAQQTLSGTVADESGMPLANANIVVEGTKDGVVTDFDGNFTLTTDREFPIKLLISYVGFETQTLTVENNGAIQVSLKEGNIFDEVIVSASRRAEKLQEAPSAVSVLNAEELSNSGGSISPIRALINSPGVELQQQTGQRINLALRGSSGVFATDVFPMLDYRSLTVQGWSSLILKTRRSTTSIWNESKWYWVQALPFTVPMLLRG